MRLNAEEYDIQLRSGIPPLLYGVVFFYNVFLQTFPTFSSHLGFGKHIKWVTYKSGLQAAAKQ